MKTCRDRFNREQEMLPKNLRKSADKIIESYNKSNAKISSTGGYNMDQLNDQAFNTFNQEALVRYI